MRFRVAAIACVATLFGGCAERPERVDNCETNPASCGYLTESTTEPRFYADPPYGLGFSCAHMGCDETRVVTIQNRGGGQLMLSRIRLSLDASRDFEFALFDDATLEDAIPKAPPTDDAPLVLEANGRVDIRVRYRPTDAASDEGFIDVRWYDGAQSFDSAIIQKVELPLRARALGQASARLLTDRVNFKYVETGYEAVEYIELENTSTGDGILTITDIDISKLPLEFALSVGFSNLANPGGRVRIPVRFLPTAVGSFQGVIAFTTNDPQHRTFAIPVMGSSIDGPSMVLVQPLESHIALGSLRLGATTQRAVIFRNEGGRGVELVPLVSGGVDHGFRLVNPRSTTLRQDIPSHVRGVWVSPFDELHFTVELTPRTGGALTGQVDLGEGTLLSVDAFGLAPQLTLDRTLHDFGDLVEGWTTSPATVRISNTGSGDLLIYGVDLEGDTTRVRITSNLDLPMRLSAGQAPLELQVIGRGAAIGDIQSTVVVRSDSVAYDVQRVQLVGRVVTCNQACPVRNGTSDCSSGRCAIGTCNEGFHDLDRDASTGCECQDERGGRDVGATCSTSLDLGWVGDDCSDYPNELSVSGVLSSREDVDVYHFRSEDGGGFCDLFSDSSETSVELADAPAGVALCAQIRDSGAGCGGYTNYFEPGLCNSRRYSHSGSAGSEDGRDVTFWLVWRPDAAPSCGSYLVRVRGREP